MEPPSESRTAKRDIGERELHDPEHDALVAIIVGSQGYTTQRLPRRAGPRCPARIRLLARIRLR